jgi:hypothetical protein
METKWFAKSLTMWGVAVGVITQYWPVLDGFLGTGVGLDVLKPVLDGIGTLLEQGGNLVAAIMIVVGRLRADTKLSLAK